MIGISSLLSVCIRYNQFSENISNVIYAMDMDHLEEK